MGVEAVLPRAAVPLATYSSGQGGPQRAHSLPHLPPLRRFPFVVAAVLVSALSSLQPPPSLYVASPPLSSLPTHPISLCWWRDR